MSKECWQDIEGFNGVYRVSNLGRIKSYKSKKNKKLKQYIDAYGYSIVTISIEGKLLKLRVHRVVYETFAKIKIKGQAIYHKDGNKLNNRFSNLRLLTSKDHYAKHIKDKDYFKRKLNSSKVADIKAAINSDKFTINYIAKCYNVSFVTISSIKNGKTWQKVQASIKYDSKILF